jgi:hypothetical protein
MRCQWVRRELPLVLFSVIVRLIILSIHGHRVDIFLPEVAEGALGHLLIGKNHQPLARLPIMALATSEGLPVTRAMRETG